jgi:hypothetical protein
MRGLRGVGSGRMWAKLSVLTGLGATPPNYAEARPFHNALIAANPHNLVWGTDGRTGAGRHAALAGVSRSHQ